MAFRYTEMGTLVATSPKEAANQLAAKFKEADGYATSVAEACGVDVATLNRWMKRLSDAGFDVRKLAKTPAKRYRPAAERQ